MTGIQKTGIQMTRAPLVTVAATETAAVAHPIIPITAVMVVETTVMVTAAAGTTETAMGIPMMKI
jgi:hypothetical protein